MATRAAQGSPRTVTSAAVTCLVADDHPAVLAAVSAIFADSGIEVVARVRNGAEALEQIAVHEPRVALLDVRMPGMSSIEVARRSLRAHPGTAIILYTGYAERAVVIEALDAGARGFVSRRRRCPTSCARSRRLPTAGRTSTRCSPA